ncbi:MAG: RluA family pseudouridine synthase [Spirochaetes bacterium]|nr:RluA family pseudouridine synthase [Spirochaetota bacterium]
MSEPAAGTPTASGPRSTTVRVLPERAGLRADAFFCLAFPLISRTRMRQKIQQGEALLNGRRFATSARVHEGDVIAVTWRGPVQEPDPGETPPAILHEDEWFVAVDKSAGQTSHPAGAVQSGTVIQQVRRHLWPVTGGRLSGGDRTAWPTLVNRLDRFTSGIVLVAKTGPALAAMQTLRERGLLERRYLAVVEGRVPDDGGIIDTPIGSAPVGEPADGESGTTVGIRMTVTPDGLPSRTEYRVVERSRDYTVLHAVPRTGRQHQIRVHFASIGHPVVGDLIYKDPALFLRYWRNGCRLDESLPTRHLLHAERLAFDHPFTGGRLVIEAPAPGDFAAVLATLASTSRS